MPRFNRRFALAIAFAYCSLGALPARADLNADIPKCRAVIVRLGDDSRGPWEQYCVGLSHAFALNHPRDFAVAMTWFRKSAAQNYAPAQAIVGYLYEMGYGTARNPDEAFRWYQRAAAQNLDDGLLNLGRAYELGIGVARDASQARTLYQRAAALGLPAARDALQGLGAPPVAPTNQQARFSEGSKLYKARDFAGAAKVFGALAADGYAPAQLQLGYQYEHGEGLTRSVAEAAKWYRRSADQNYAPAQNNLGTLYEYGLGVPEDWVQAAAWFQRSAAQGNSRGQFALGRAYQFGIGVPQNRQTAIAWFDRAANQGDNQANIAVNQLKSSGNFVGFRDDHERNLVIGNTLRTSTRLVYAEPRGVTFRTSAQRFQYLRGVAAMADSDEADQRRAIAELNYRQCKEANVPGVYCARP